MDKIHKLNLIFVDDDINNLRSLKRLFYDMRDEWDFHFAENGIEALNIIDQNSTAVIVSDMRMPNMDGGDLLNIIRERFPAMIRVIVSGYTDQSMITKTVTSADNFISKPYDVENFKNYLRTLHSALNNIGEQNLSSLGPRTSPIFIFPETYHQIKEFLKYPQKSLEPLYKLIESDPYLLYKIINLANGDFYNPGVNSLNHERAILNLGYEVFRELFIHQNIFQPIPKDVLAACPLTEIYQHAIFHSNSARFLLKEMGKDYETQNTIYTITLMLYLPIIVLILNNPFLYDELKLHSVFLSPTASLNQYFLNTRHMSLNQITACLFDFAGFPANPILSKIEFLDADSNPTLPLDLYTKIVHFTGKLCHELLPYKNWNQIYHFSSVQFQPDEIEPQLLKKICAQIIRNQNQ
ncbi:MAG: response regulator [Candidatus Omnitrophica bacterium]|nr:response regulator [Candidatus Omnitrophota bacterium]